MRAAGRRPANRQCFKVPNSDLCLEVRPAAVTEWELTTPSLERDELSQRLRFQTVTSETTKTLRQKAFQTSLSQLSRLSPGPLPAYSTVVSVVSVVSAVPRPLPAYSTVVSVVSVVSAVPRPPSLPTAQMSQLSQLSQLSPGPPSLPTAQMCQLYKSRFSSPAAGSLLLSALAGVAQ